MDMQTPTTRAPQRRTRGKPNDVDIHVGRRLRERRVLLGWSQEKLAAAIELTFQQVQKYERGTNRLGAGRLYQVATVLGVSVHWFFEGLDGADPVAGLPAGPNRTMLRAMRAMDAMPPAVQTRFADLAQSVAGMGGADGGAGDDR